MYSPPPASQMAPAGSPVGTPVPPKKVPAWKRGKDQEINLFPDERIARRGVDVDITFQRCLQMCEYLLDRMEEEINHSDGFVGVPDNFPSNLRELSGSMNTLSLAHARWLKANEEMYESLSDDEKLKALQAWMVALYGTHPTVVSGWLSKTATLCKQAAASRGTVPGRLGGTQDFHDVSGLPPGRSPELTKWHEVAEKVKAEFRAKKRDKFPKPGVPRGPKVPVDPPDQDDDADGN